MLLRSIFRHRAGQLALAAICLLIPKGFAGTASAQQITSTDITPTTTCAATTITVQGNLNCVNATFDGMSVVRDGSDINVEVHYLQDLICLPAITPYEQRAAGPVVKDPGTYSLNVKFFENGISVAESKSAVEFTGEVCDVPVQRISFAAAKARFRS